MLLVLLCLQGALHPAALLAQDRRGITLELKQSTVEQAIIAIENTTAYGFAYRAADLPVTPLRDYAFRNATIQHVMDVLLEGTGMEWSISGNIVTITRGTARAVAPAVARGRVVDQNGAPLPGVTVLVKGTSNATASDGDGRFSLRVPEGRATLVFSFIGKQPREVAFDGQGDIEVQLEDTAAEIGEVVVTGIFNKAAESYTGAATFIPKEVLEASGNHDLLSTLRNVDPSFNVVDNIEYGSDPNRLPDITIRGRASMDADLRDIESDASSQSTANLPLFIVDGFEVSLRRIQDMDASQVESITLLKDASATALYGSRGANGIVVITTVRPEPGKLRFTYKGGLNIEVPDLKSYDLMNAREKLEYEQAAGIYSSVFPTADLDYQRLYNERYIAMERGVDTYWLKYPVRTGVGHRHSVRVEGGDDSFLYAGGVGYNDVAGVMKGSSRKTTTANLFFQYTVGDFRFQNDLSLTFNNSSESPYGRFSEYTYLNPYETPYNEDGSLKKMLVNRTMEGDYRRLQVGNPLYNATLPSKNTSKYNQLQNNFAVEWRILPELLLRGSLTLIKQTGQSDYYLSAKHTSFENLVGDDFGRRGSYTYGTNSSDSYEGSFTLNYNKSFGKHQLYAGLNYNFAEAKDKTYTVMGVGFAALNMDNLGMAMGYPADGKPQSTENRSRRLGGTANVNYTYDQRYFVDLSGKVEGSSKFGAHDKVAPFWSAGVGWNIHNESFFKGGRAVNLLRLRLSYGTSGSQNFNPYQAMETYRYFDQLNYMYWNGSYLMAMGNPDLGWQQTGQWNLGLDLSLFNNRLRINADFYDKLTNDLLSDINLPLSSGFNSYKANVGKVRNRGVELSANVFVIRNTSSGISWNVGASMMHNSNKILKISNSLEFLNEQLLSESSTNPSFLFKEGQSMNTIFAVRSLGIDPANGREIFVKADGTRTFTWNSADQVACGVEEPKIWGNVNTTFRYKGLSLNMIFSYRLGGYIYNQTLASKVENVDPWKNADRRVLTDRWQGVGDVAYFKSVTDMSATNASSRFVMKENTFQCRSLNVEYEIDRTWLEKHLRLQYLSIGVYFEDLFRISTVKQERGTSYPFAHKYSLTLTARF